MITKVFGLGIPMIQLFFNYGWNMASCERFDIQGRSLLTKAIMGESFVALPFRFAPGLYVLQLSSGHMVKSVKLLVR